VPLYLVLMLLAPMPLAALPSGFQETVVFGGLSQPVAVRFAIERALAGEEVIIGKAGKPVAKLVKYQCSEELRRPGALKGQIKIADDFDELPEGIDEAFGVKKP